jgi:hypothetical protein
MHLVLTVLRCSYTPVYFHFRPPISHLHERPRIPWATLCSFHAEYKIGGRDFERPSFGRIKVQGGTPLERGQRTSNYRNLAGRRWRDPS